MAAGGESGVYFFAVRLVEHQDVATGGLLALAIAYPIAAAAIALALVLLSAWLVFAEWRALRLFLEPKRPHAG